MTIVAIVCDQADLFTVGLVLCKAPETTWSVNSVADPGSGAFLTPGSEIRDPG
jgi:hypothetical protein